MNVGACRLSGRLLGRSSVSGLPLLCGSFCRRWIRRFFLWNVFPFHPHHQGQPFSNRTHRATEARCGRAILRELVDMLRPERLVMIGNDAAESARRVCSTTEMMRVAASELWRTTAVSSSDL